MNIKLILALSLFSSSILANTAADNIKIPFNLAKGQYLYEKNCSVCHGKQLQGTDKGPTFISAIYKVSHHGDASFYRAALQGVRAHHWNFGDMLPVPEMSERKMKSIIPFIRYYQKQKGM